MKSVVVIRKKPGVRRPQIEYLYYKERTAGPRVPPRSADKHPHAAVTQAERRGRNT